MFIGVSKHPFAICSNKKADIIFSWFIKNSSFIVLNLTLLLNILTLCSFAEVINYIKLQCQEVLLVGLLTYFVQTFMFDLVFIHFPIHGSTYVG